MRHIALLVLLTLIASDVTAQRPKPVWVCDSPDGVRGAQDRPCPEGYIILRSPEGWASPTPPSTPSTPTTTAPTPPRILPSLRSAVIEAMAPASTTASTGSITEPSRSPATSNPFAPLIKMVWTAAGIVIAVLLILGIARVVFYKRSLGHILTLLGLIARDQTNRRQRSHRRAAAGRTSARPASSDRETGLGPMPWPKPPSQSASPQQSAPSQAPPPSTSETGNPEPQVHRPAPYPEGWSMDLLRTMDWRLLETLVCRYWQIKGYNAATTGPGADGGVDVILRDRQDPQRVIAVAQCKSWTRCNVGVESVRALWGTRDHFKAQLALFYTVYGFTEAASEFATSKHLKLIDGHSLLTQINALPKEDAKALLREITEGDYTTPSCPKCESKMVFKRGTEGKHDFWACPRFPVCRSSTMRLRRQ